MEEFKVGEKVVIIGGTTIDSQEHVGETVTIGQIKNGGLSGRPDYFLVKGWKFQTGIYLDEVEKLPVEKKVEVKKQRKYEDFKGNLGLVYTTNTKKDRVSILVSGGRASARIKFGDVDSLIEQLNRLKDEVALDDDSLQA